MKYCCVVVQFGSSKGLLAVNTIENVYILVEQLTSVHCSSGVGDQHDVCTLWQWGR